MNLPHCSTCQCTSTEQSTEQTDVSDVSCYDELQLAHETFKCEKPKDHDGWHDNRVICPPCGSCHGYELHADGCPEIDGDGPDLGSWVAIYWDDNAVVVVQNENDPEPTGPVICQWFARCNREAVTMVLHPVLHAVPSCQQHAEFARG